MTPFPVLGLRQTQKPVFSSSVQQEESKIIMESQDPLTKSCPRQKIGYRPVDSRIRSHSRNFRIGSGHQNGDCDRHVICECHSPHPVVTP